MMTRLTLPVLLLASLLLLGGLLLRDGVTVPVALGQQVPDCAVQPYAVAQVPAAPQLNLELALTDEQRQRGLMNRYSMPDDQGMLFVFSAVKRGPFWNMNTFIPLTIAFIGEDGTILDLQDMQVFEPGQQPIVYYPAAAYLYALEVNQGWFARQGIQVGDVLAFCLPPI